jgi:hypothetical protein
MRANKIVRYESILQVLAETGCPFCRFMKNFQAALLQDPRQEDIHHLCSFHTWGLAATQRAASAAGVFLNLLARQHEADTASLCDGCVLLQLEEDRRVREFIGCAATQAGRAMAEVRSGSLHGPWRKAETGGASGSGLRHHRRHGEVSKQLVDELTHLRDEYQPDTAKWGVLGHAADFLVSQRGLHA